MPVSKSPAEEAMNAVVRDAVTTVLKPLGFTKTANNFHRRLGSCVQVVNIQGSMGSTSLEKLFYVNIGLAFDEICRHMKRPVTEKPKEHECLSLGMRARLEALVNGAADRWDVAGIENVERVVQRLRPRIEEMALDLNKIDSIASFRNSAWYSRDLVPGLQAQVEYLLGNKEAARSIVTQITENFAGREVLNQRSHWIRELKLDGLDA